MSDTLSVSFKENIQRSQLRYSEAFLLFDIEGMSYVM